MRRRRRCLPEARAAMAARAGATGPTRARPTPTGGARARRWRRRGATIAEALGWRHDVILTSGASEAIQIVAARAKIEAPASSARPSMRPSLHAMGERADGPPGRCERPDRSAGARASLAAGPALVAVQLVNNETGVDPADRATSSEMVRERGLAAACRLCAGGWQDCASRMPTSSRSPATSSAALPASGALLVRDLATLEPSGGQERGYRRGTENLPAARWHGGGAREPGLRPGDAAPGSAAGAARARNRSPRADW